MARSKQASRQLAETLKRLARAGTSASAIIFTIVLLFAPSAWAGTFVGGSGICKLPRTPWVPHRATPENLECLIDEDDDGIDDEIEALLANCFRPNFHFADTEITSATNDPTFPGNQEPFTAFNVFPHVANSSGAPGIPTRIQIKYATLYREDGGFYKLNIGDPAYLPVISPFLDIPFWDSHPGDSDAVDVYLDIQPDKAGNWTAELVGVHTGNQHWDLDKTGSTSGQPVCDTTMIPIGLILVRVTKCKPPAQVEELTLVAETHPKVIASHGKHHYYLNVKQGEWRWDSVEVADVVDGYLCSFLGCPWNGWTLVYEQVERTVIPNTFGVFPVLEMPYPEPGDPIIPTNLGTLKEGLTIPNPNDTQLECTFLTAMFDAVCACDPVTAFACPPDPQDPAACVQLAADRDAVCQPAPFLGSQTSACWLRRGLSAPSHFIGDLFSVFPGESFKSSENFCGGDTGADKEDCSSPAAFFGALPASFDDDSDGDGKANWNDLCPTIPGPGGGADHPDADGDGAGDECDPNPLFRDRFVGSGFPEVNHAAYITGSGFQTDPKKRGWADTDSDGILNGADFCPANAGAIADKLSNPNAWGEGASFPGTGKDAFKAYRQDGCDPTQPSATCDIAGAHEPSEKSLGFVTRGTSCDPYEASFIDMATNESDENWGGPCDPLGYFGRNALKTRVTPVRGVSPNDPVLSKDPNDPTQKLTYLERMNVARTKTAPVLVDPKRCGCPEWGSGGDATCFDRETGTCPQRAPLQGNPNAGTSWIPVERSACFLRQGYGDGSFCALVPAIAKVPPPSVCPAFPATCPSDPALDPKPIDVTWQWLAERNAKPAHFPGDWFQKVPSAIDPNDPTKSYYAAKPGLRFSIAARTYLSLFTFTGGGIISADTDDEPHRHPGFPGLPRLVGNEADVNPDRVSSSPIGQTVPKEEGDERASNLRTTFSGTFVELVEEHIAPRQPSFVPEDGCNALEEERTKNESLVGLPWENCVPKEICERRQSGFVILVRLADPDNTSLVDLGTGMVQLVAVVNPQGDLVGGIDCFVTGDCGGRTGQAAQAVEAEQIDQGAAWKIVPLAGYSTERRERPPLLLLAGSGGLVDQPDRAFLLRFHSSGEHANYIVARSGTAPHGTASADFVHTTDDGRHVVAFRGPANGAPGWLRTLDVGSFEWTEVGLDSAVGERTGASFALHDNALYRAGGHDGTALRGDVLALDWRSGAIVETGIADGVFPPRLSPAVSWDARGRGLVYGGGMDAAGAERSDLWSLRVGTQLATRLAADTPLPPDTTPLRSGSYVAASGASGGATWWGAPYKAPDGSVTHDVWVIHAGRWVPADFRTLTPTARRCPNGSEPRACSAGPEWWRDAGESCGGSCSPQAIESTATTAQLAGNGARDIALDGATLWVARGEGVELWSLAAEGQPEKLDVFDVGAPVRAIAAGEDAVGIGSDAGFVRIAPALGQCTAIEPITDLCGAATDVISLGQGAWLVGTTAGAALLRPGPTGALEKISEVFLDLGPGGAMTAVPIDGSAAAMKKCAQLDKLGCASQCSGIRDRRLAFDGARAEIARKGTLGRLGWNGSGDIELVDSIKIGGTIRGVRATAETAYLVVGDGQGKEVVVLLGSALSTAGSHDVGQWLFAEQSEHYRARLLPGGHVEAAWIHR